jgi:hypothetical protein
VSTWVGANDTPESGAWSPSNPAGMVETAAYVYDNGGVGDGNLTQATLFTGEGSNDPDEVTDYYYDWRDRLVAEKDGVQSTESDDVNRPIYYFTYDNLNEVTETQVYDGDGVTIASSGGVPQAPAADLLRAQTETDYDNLGEVYQVVQYSVDPNTGEVGVPDRIVVAFVAELTL